MPGMVLGVSGYVSSTFTNAFTLYSYWRQCQHNLALALHDKGYTITGSDDVIFEPSRSRLEAAGILPGAEGWFPDKITPAWML